MAWGHLSVRAPTDLGGCDMSPGKYRRFAAALAFGSIVAVGSAAIAQSDASQVRAVEISSELQTKIDKD